MQATKLLHEQGNFMPPMKPQGEKLFQNQYFLYWLIATEQMQVLLMLVISGDDSMWVCEINFYLA